MTEVSSNSDFSPIINGIGEEFESQLRSGDRPRIKSFLARVETELREPLFRKLVEIEISFAKENGVEFPLDDLASSFPSYSGIIEDIETNLNAIHEDTLDINLHSDSKINKLNDTVEGIANFGRYELLDELGSGAMGVVYPALHVSIKRLVNNSHRANAKFIKQFLS